MHPSAFWQEGVPAPQPGRAGMQAGLGWRQRCSGRTWVTIWSPSPQAPPSSQAPALLPVPLLTSSHPVPTLPLSSSAFSLSRFLLSSFSSSSVNNFPFLHILLQSAPLLFFWSSALFLHCSPPSSTKVQNLSGCTYCWESGITKSVVTLIQVKILHAAFIFPSRV